jgi:hypothetical protein
MEGVSGLLQGRVFFLSIERVAGRRSRIHDWWRLKVGSRYEICFTSG